MEIRIEGRMGPVCVVSLGALHGDPFELVKGVAILVGYGDGGGFVWRVCSRCALAGEDSLEGWILARNGRLRQEAQLATKEVCGERA
jgi:hypothetical protein